MSGAGRGVTPGAEPEAGSGGGATPPVPDQSQPVNADDRSGASGSAGGGNGPAAQAKTGGEANASAAGASAAGANADGASAAGASPDDGAASVSSEQAGSGAGNRRTAARRRRKKRSFWREFPILVVVALLLAVVIKTYAIQAFFIPSGSMENTLEINDRVLVNKLVYDVRSIHRGDIVVFNGDGSWDPGTGAGQHQFRREVRRRICQHVRLRAPGRHPHQAGHRAARRQRGLLRRAGPGHGQRRSADRAVVPVPRRCPLRDQVQHRRAAGPAVGDGRPPAHFRRLPGSTSAIPAAARSRKTR